jgi:hypothetical protein
VEHRENPEDRTRGGFLEDGYGSFTRSGKDSIPPEQAEIQAKYDFKGTGIELPGGGPVDRKGDPIQIKLTGEIKYDLWKKVIVTLIRVAIVVLFWMLFIRGSSCSYAGNTITCT